MKDSRALIIEVCDEMKEVLLDKNRKYGDSALNPVRIFSKAEVLEQISVRMDDKLSRIKSGQDDDNEDPYDDLLGYLLLRKVAIKFQDQLENPVIPFEQGVGYLPGVGMQLTSAKPEDQYEVGN